MSRKAERNLFGRRMARLRRQKGLTQQELGEMVGLSQRMVTYYERESDGMPAYLVARVAKALRVSADELLGLRRMAADGSPKHPRIWRKLKEIENLSSEERRALVKVLEGLLARGRSK